MPYSSPKPCTFPGCPALVRVGARCDAHKGPVSPADERRPNSNARGYTRTWRKLRLMVLRARPICQWTGCNDPAEHVDHIVSLRDGGTNELSNLQGLCGHHHSVKTCWYDGGFGLKRRRANNQAKENTPWKIVSHPQ